MASATLERVMEEVKAMTPDEQQQLRDALRVALDGGQRPVDLDDGARPPRDHHLQVGQHRLQDGVPVQHAQRPHHPPRTPSKPRSGASVPVPTPGAPTRC